MNSCVWLNLVDFYSGLGSSLYEIARRLSPELRAKNLLLEAFKDFLVCNCVVGSQFPEYLSQLKKLDAVEMRDQCLERMIKVVTELEKDEVLPHTDDLDVILNNADLYVEYGKLHSHRTWRDFDPNIYRTAHELLQNPKDLKEEIINHLAILWKDHFKEEWARSQPELARVAEAFEEIDWGNLAPDETIRSVIGRDLLSNSWLTQMKQSERVIFIPTSYLGPYAAISRTEDSLCVLFGAHYPKPTGQPERPILNRDDLLTKLNVLSDEKRMRILEMIIARGHATTPDVMKELELGQSSASRHLIHMCVAGLLKQKRVNRTKHYRIDPSAIESILETFKQFLP